MNRGAIDERIQTTQRLVDRLRNTLRDALGKHEATIIGDHTTFILTGSAGRGEMTSGSDIDGYVVRIGKPLDKQHDARLLCATVDALAELGLPPLDRGGEFLAMKSDSSLIECLGSANDDHSNALTVRMLFLLEGQPLVGEQAYETLLQTVQGAYRSTASQHRNDFLPFFLVNDIIRYWRTVLLNHEDRLRQKKSELEKLGIQGEELHAQLLAHRRYRSQKLRFPRCATCFSALAYILTLAEAGNVSEECEKEMFRLAPLERLARIAELRPGTKAQVSKMRGLYARYLERSHGSKKEIVQRFRDDPNWSKTVSTEALQFTEEMFRLIQSLGKDSRLYRQMLI